MEKIELVSIINQHFDKMIDNINKEAENPDLDGKTDYEIEESKERIETDKAEIIKEVNKIKKLTLDQLDSKIGSIKSIFNTDSVKKDEQIDMITQKLFENGSCFHISNKYFVEEYRRYVGVLFSTPFYLGSKEIEKIK